MTTVQKENPNYTMTARSYDSMAQMWNEKYRSIEPIRKQLDAFVRMMPKGGTVLDIGCATGRDVEYLARNGLFAVGIDKSKGMIDIARAKLPFLEFRQMDMVDLQFKAGSFDGILSIASLHHLNKQDAARALQECRRVMKDRGYIFITVLGGLKDEVFGDAEGQNKRFFSCYARGELDRLLEQNHFEVVNSYSEEGKGSHGSTWMNVLARSI